MEFVYLPIETSKEVMSRRVGVLNVNDESIIYPEPLKSDYMLDFMARPENRMKIPACLIWYKEYDKDTEEGEIDRLVYDLYGLTEDEIAKLEGTTK